MRKMFPMERQRKLELASQNRHDLLVLDTGPVQPLH